jgi:hypothetical protein
MIKRAARQRRCGKIADATLREWLSTVNERLVLNKACPGNLIKTFVALVVTSEHPLFLRAHDDHYEFEQY